MNNRIDITLCRILRLLDMYQKNKDYLIYNLDRLANKIMATNICRINCLMPKKKKGFTLL